MQVTQASWLQTEIAELAQRNPKKDTPAFSSLEPIVETWICRLNKESVEGKKEQITAVASWIRVERKFNTHQMGLALYLLERVCLSRRVSSLCHSKFYERTIEEKQNHVLKMKGLEHIIRTRFPDINLFVCKNEIPSNGEAIRAKLTEKEVWIIVKMYDLGHKNLILIQKEFGYTVTLFDSLGLNLSMHGHTGQKINQFKEFYLKIVTSIVGDGQDIPVFRHEISRQRQVDHVNCASYIASDLEIALQLLKEKKPLFTGETPHPLFYRTNQYCLKRGDSHVLPEYIIPHDEKFEGNVLPTLIALDTFEALLRQVSLSPKDHVEEGKSEEEKENCTIS
jgi:hypothetical protein